MRHQEKQPMPRRIITAVLVLSIVFSSSFLALSQKAAAEGVPLGVPINEIGGNLFTNIITTGQTTLSASVDYFLNPLAIQIAKAILRRMTGSILNWINSGFQGKPSFLTNPGTFFQNIAKEQTNIFIIQLVGEKTNNPYAMDIAISILNPRKSGYTLYDDMVFNCQIRGGGNSCPPNLSSPYARAELARQFVYGNAWGVGGWNTWYSLTQNPMNNVYGAYIDAQNRLAQKKAQATGYAQQDLSQSGGFLSFKKCVHEVSYEAQPADADDNYLEAGETVKYCDKWETQTPGKAAADYLTSSITSPIRQGELAKTFMDAVGAITEAFVNQVIMMGVKSLSDSAAGVVSGGGNSFSGSFTGQLINNTGYTNTSLSGPQSSSSSNVSAALQSEDAYRAAKNKVIDILSGEESDINNLAACYYRIIKLDPTYTTKEPVASGLTFASSTVKDVINPKRASVNADIASSTLISAKLDDFKQKLASSTDPGVISSLYQQFLSFNTSSAHNAAAVALVNADIYQEQNARDSLMTTGITPRLTTCEAKEEDIMNPQGSNQSGNQGAI